MPNFKTCFPVASNCQGFGNKGIKIHLPHGIYHLLLFYSTRPISCVTRSLPQSSCPYRAFSGPYRCPAPPWQPVGCPSVSTTSPTLRTPWRGQVILNSVNTVFSVAVTFCLKLVFVDIDWLRFFSALAIFKHLTACRYQIQLLLNFDCNFFILVLDVNAIQNIFKDLFS